MSGLGWPVLSFSLASGAALGCLFLLFRGFSRLLGLKKLGTALLDVLFGGLAGGFVFLCALAVDSGRLRLYQVLPQAVKYLTRFSKGKKAEKTEKKDLKNLCIPVYNRNNMGVLYQG